MTKPAIFQFISNNYIFPVYFGKFPVYYGKLQQDSIFEHCKPRLDKRRDLRILQIF